MNTRQSWLNIAFGPSVYRSIRFWLVILVALYVISLTLILPPVLRDQIQNQTPILIRDIDFNPFTLSLRVEQLVLPEANADGVVAEIDQATVNLSISSLWTSGIVLDALKIHSLNFNARFPTGQPVNLVRAWPHLFASDPTAIDTERDPLHITIHAFQLESSSVLVEREIGDKQVRNVFTPINFTMQQFSTLPAAAAPKTILAETGTQTQISWNGDLDLHQGTIEGTLKVTNADLSTLAEHLPQLQATVDSGLLTLSLPMAARFSAPFSFQISQGSATLQSLQVFDGNDTDPVNRVEIQEIAIPQIAYSFPEHQLELNRVSITQPLLQTAFHQGKSGFADWWQGAADQEASQSPALTLLINDVELQSGNGQVHVMQTAHSWQSTIEDVQLKLAQFQHPGMQIQDLHVSGVLNSAPFSTFLSGQLAPLDARFNANIDHYPLPTLNDAVNLTAAKIQEGRFTLQLEGEVDTQLSPTVRGVFAFEDVQLQGDTGEQLVSLQSLRGDAVQWGDQIASAELRVHGLIARLVRHEDGTLNWRALLPNSKPGKPSAEQSDAAATTIKLPLISVEDSRITWKDQSLPQPFQARLSDLKGAITGFDSRSPLHAQFNLQAVLDDYAPVEVAGNIRPLDAGDASDLRFSLQGYEMPVLSPYSRFYLSRELQQGKLDLNLSYRVDETTLTGENAITMNAIAFGQKQPSEADIGLPVGLAVALLKDSDGALRLNVPVRGDLNDPEFRFGHLVFRAIFSLITEIVASPFKLLTKLIPDAQVEGDLNQLQFMAGSAEINAPARQKAAGLATILQKRPELQLSLTGHIHAEKDREALAIESLMATSSLSRDQLTQHPSQPLLQWAQQHAPDVWQSVVQADGETITPNAQSQAILMALIQRHLPTENALQALANARAEAVRTHILEVNTEISASRIYISQGENLETGSSVAVGILQ